MKNELIHSLKKRDEEIKKLDKPDVRKHVKVGDRITATVYQGDMTLHNFEVVSPDKAGKQKSK